MVLGAGVPLGFMCGSVRIDSIPGLMGVGGWWDGLESGLCWISSLGVNISLLL